jgi:hypothetical protein
MLLMAIMVFHEDNHAKHIITLCGKTHTVLMLQQMVHRVTLNGLLLVGETMLLIRRKKRYVIPYEYLQFV